MTRKEDAGGVSENVKVVVRCRPLNSEEVQDGRKRIVSMDTKAGQIFIKNPKAPEEPPKTFSFDLVYDENVRQIDLYNEVARPVVESVIEGFNGTIFAYGQTGTGKTHTMDGGSTAESQGIIPNSFDQVFNFIAATDHREFLVRGSFLEIYNEEIRDLLSRNPKNKLELKEDQDGGVFVKDLSNYVVKSVSDIKQVLEVGKRNRSVGATKMNLGSSRSHSVFTITIESTMRDERGDEHVRVGKLNLVDLAGSERATKTGATGDRFKEGVKINLSLAALGNVINALVEGKSGHIPYRDSKLTRLLQDSLGGNTKTCMVANIGPADWNFDETMSTLRYANRAKNIQNKPKINEDPKDALIREYQDEMKRLEEQLKEIEAHGGSAAVLKPKIIEEVEIKKRQVTEDEKEAIRREIEAQLRRQASNQGSVSLSPEEVQRIQEEAEREAEEQRRRLEEERERARREAEEKAKLLSEKEREMQGARERAQLVAQAKSQLAAKLQAMQNKVLHGGGKDELAKKAKEKEAEIAKQMQDLENRRKKEREAAEKIKEFERRRVEKDQKYASLSEERDAKKRVLEELWAQLQGAHRDVSDVEAEFDRERKFFMEQLQELQSQLKLREAIIAAFIPPDEQSKVMVKAVWDEDAEEWLLGQVSERAENATSVKRPVSASGTRRPMSSFAKAQAAQGDQNPRFKSENILTLELDMPERTTYVFSEETLSEPAVRDALQALFVDGQVFFQG